MRIAETEPPDLILLDVLVEDMDGYEVCRRLKRNPRLKSIPVIFISSLEETADKIKAFAAGGVDYITKPFHQQEVLARVKTHLDIRRLQVSLRYANGLMEARVRERTIELEERNRCLQKSEREIKHLKNYLDNILNSMPSILVGVDAKGRVTHWNQGAFQAAGLTPEQIRGHRLEEVFPRFAGLLSKLEEAIHDHHPLTLEKVESRSNGESRYENITIFPLLTDGVEGAVFRIDDVTARVRLEELMLQSEKMLYLGGLAAGMAHEINNPLAGILQNAEVVAERLDGELPANEKAAAQAGLRMDAIRSYHHQRDIPRLLTNIRESGARAAKIVRDMLDFAKKSQSARKPCDPGLLFDKTLELAADDYNLKKKHDFDRIAIIREYDHATPPVLCDENSIQQVLFNIIRNAAEAMSAASSPATTPRLVLRTARDGAMARLEIEDNGPGMDEATRRRVFEPFFTTKPAGMGTGLGLSISYFIVTERHHGTIEVETGGEGGTTFVIRLPVSELPLQERPIASRTAASEPHVENTVVQG